MTPYRRSRWRGIWTVVIVLALVALRWWSDGLPPAVPNHAPPPGSLRPGLYEVERVVDGDTLILRTPRTRVRLQGVDSPETVREDAPVEPWGPEASQFTKAFVADARGRLRVEIDGEPVDKHGRSLAFVYDGQRLLNEELVRAGLARARLHYNYSQRMKDRLRRAERDAQRAAVGLWSREPRRD